MTKVLIKTGKCMNKKNLSFEFIFTIHKGYTLTLTPKPFIFDI
jgi:hypothetical protein